MNIKDMQLLIATVKDVDEAAQSIDNIFRNREIVRVLSTALTKHRHQIIREFEDRHNVNIDKGITTHEQA